jgi:Ca-activated chloride channel homolog
MNLFLHPPIRLLIVLLAAAGCSVPQTRGRAAAAPPVLIGPAISSPEATAIAPAPSAAESLLPQSAQAQRPVANAAVISPSSDEHVTLRAALSHTAYTQSAPTQLLFKVEFSCADKRPQNRPPLNLALVLDRSASMAGDMKFPHALAAARAVIENLTERDTISLVAFNERTLVLSPASRVVNKPFLFQRLSEVAPDGITDLSAGLLEGIAQVNSQSAEGQVKHVLLLTDGKANSGIMDSAVLRKIVEAAHAKGIGVSTLACGTDFDERLLTDMATAGGGRYTYVKSSEQLPTAFREELRGLLEVVAQNVRLEVTVQQGSISKVYGRPWQQTSPSLQLPIGNLRAGERGTVMLALKPSDFKRGAALEITAKLTYDAPETSERMVRAATSRSEFAAQRSGEQAEANEEVVLCGAVMDAMDLAMSALRDFDLDRYTKARVSFDQWHERVRQYALAHRNQDLLNEAFLLKHFMTELEVIRNPGAPPLLSDTRSQLQKQSDYQTYQLLHQPVAQNK